MYQALYRKYRPKNFNDVVGQNYVIQTLKNSILNSKISHAYMFFGPRGIGKTTIAKILSRAVNCEKSDNGNPCEKCDSCKKSVNSVDIIEIDAASNNGVDEIREIKNNVNIVPTELRYKVYIIDEVHMLTASAFNALLKTLEEPPKHVIFILATTDPQKVSETIVSRCQCYSFKRISIKDIVEKLAEVCEEEKIDIDEKVLKMIAEFSNGGLRDSLGMLDKLSSYKNGKIEEEDFYEINDMVSTEELESFKRNIINGDVKKVIEQINKYNDNGKNLIEIMIHLLNNLRDELMDYYINKSDINDIDRTISLTNKINEKMFDIKKSSNPKIYIEIMLLNYMKNIDSDNENISREIIPIHKNVSVEHIQEEKDKKIEENIKISELDSSENESASNDINTNIDEIMKIRINNILSTADKKEKENDIKLIQTLNEFVFDQRFGHLISELLNAQVCASSSDGLLLSYEYKSVVDQNISQLGELTDIYRKYSKNKKKLAIVTNEEWLDIKKEYINNIKNGKKYDIIEEPELIDNNKSSVQDAKKESAIDLFKDIVEIE